MSKEPSGKRVGQLNFNTVIGMVAVGAIGWIGTLVTKTNDKVTRIEAMMEFRSEQIVEIRKDIAVLQGIMGLKPKQP